MEQLLEKLSLLLHHSFTASQQAVLLKELNIIYNTVTVVSWDLLYELFFSFTR
jgi:hypothetical protein